MEVIPLAVLAGLYVLANNKTERKESFRPRRRALPNTNTPVRNFPVENKEEIMNHLNYYKTNPNSSGTDKLFNKVRVLSKTGNVVEASKAEQKEETRVKKSNRNFEIRI